MCQPLERKTWFGRASVYITLPYQGDLRNSGPRNAMASVAGSSSYTERIMLCGGDRRLHDKRQSGRFVIEVDVPLVFPEIHLVGSVCDVMALTCKRLRHLTESDSSQLTNQKSEELQVFGISDWARILTSLANHSSSNADSIAIEQGVWEVDL
ncbi:hypothetical protein PoB_006544500 [Plakobranchus ocellatus]|uniref:Uncharacterized protein n=1 Tax=Plakobranchus ocellatus TaxID=259542 RepID=A0AAV4D4M5_9GAST|nr:hypothetical protein PoB_006544500 [Plakobranchus ocellatus]